MARSIKARMLAHGFEFCHTGGNCTAYVRDDGEIEEWITEGDEGRVPIRQSERVTIGTGTEDQHLTGEVDLVQNYTLGDVLAALDDPRDEYYLLALRLHNGYGKRSRGGRIAVGQRVIALGTIYTARRRVKGGWILSLPNGNEFLVRTRLIKSAEFDV